MTSFGAIIGLRGEQNTDIIAIPFISAFAIEVRNRFEYNRPGYRLQELPVGSITICVVLICPRR
jgi:hypothetical protein